MDLMREQLVSIITVFYNEEKYLPVFFDSLLAQTYRTIEIICVDDGSEDDSREIVEQYVPKFLCAGMQIKYMYQDNSGQASATNSALKHVNGDYLCWIDSDDFIYPESIEKRVRFLEKHKEFGFVSSDFYLWNEMENSKKRKGGLYKNLNWQADQFRLAVAGESIIENLSYMLRVDALKKINPKMEIECIKAGQNYQLLLPMMFYYKRGYLDEPLGCYRIHADSHYHTKRTQVEELRRLDELILMVDHIFTDLGLDNRTKRYLLRDSTFAKEKRRCLSNG